VFGSCVVAFCLCIFVCLLFECICFVFVLLSHLHLAFSYIKKNRKKTAHIKKIYFSVCFTFALSSTFFFYIFNSLPLVQKALLPSIHCHHIHLPLLPTHTPLQTLLHPSTLSSAKILLPWSPQLPLHCLNTLAFHHKPTFCHKLHYILPCIHIQTNSHTTLFLHSFSSTFPFPFNTQNSLFIIPNFQQPQPLQPSNTPTKLITKPSPIIQPIQQNLHYQSAISPYCLNTPSFNNQQTKTQPNIKTACIYQSTHTSLSYSIRYQTTASSFSNKQLCHPPPWHNPALIFKSAYFLQKLIPLFIFNPDLCHSKLPSIFSTKTPINTFHSFTTKSCLPDVYHPQPLQPEHDYPIYNFQVHTVHPINNTDLKH